MKKLLFFCVIAILLLSGCVANDRNDLFYGETPEPALTATPEITATPTLTETPQNTEIPADMEILVATEAPTATPTLKAEATPINSKGVKKYVIGDKVNVRKSNSTSADKIAMLYKGDEVMAYSSGGGWTFIGFSGNRYGYVNSKYLSTAKPSDNTATAEPTPTATVAPTATPTVEPTQTPTAPPILSPAATPEDDESFDLPEDML